MCVGCVENGTNCWSRLFFVRAGDQGEVTRLGEDEGLFVVANHVGRRNEHK